ncbi:MAG: helix-turn-helix domain-containing protein [Candidatus Woesearchaeota archaeon]
MGEKLGVAEVAEIYDVTKRTIYNRLKSGELPAEKVKNEKGVEVWQIDRDDVIDPAIYNEVFGLDNIDVQIEKEMRFPIKLVKQFCSIKFQCKF